MEQLNANLSTLALCNESAVEITANKELIPSYSSVGASDDEISSTNENSSTAQVSDTSKQIISLTAEERSYAEQGSAFIFETLSSFEDIVFFRSYHGPHYLAYRQTKEIPYLVAFLKLDPVPSSVARPLIEDSLSGRLFVHHLLTGVRRLQDKLSIQDQHPKNKEHSRITVRFGNLFIRARTKNEVAFSGFSDQLIRLWARSSNKWNPRKGDFSAVKIQPGHGRGDVNNDIRSTHFHPGLQTTSGVEDFLIEEGFERFEGESPNELFQCSLKLADKEIDVNLDANLKFVSYRFQPTVFANIDVCSKNAKSASDFRLKLQRLRTNQSADNSGGDIDIASFDPKSKILMYDSRSDRLPFMAKSIRVSYKYENSIKFIRQKSLTRFKMPVNRSEEGHGEKWLAQAMVEIASIRDFEWYDERSQKFKKVGEPHPEIKISMRELPDLSDEKAWLDLGWSLLKFTFELSEVLSKYQTLK